MFPLVEVPPDASDLPEQLGTKRKFWYRNANQDPFLFKEGRPNTGENWAEKVSCELCTLLGIPHAHYELAVWRNHQGVVTPKFVPEDGRLVLGNELLGKLIKGYPHTTRYKARQHTVPLVMAIMKWPKIGLPIDYAAPRPAFRASEVFVGYLMLDVLIANQDRHHENWGLILSPGRKVTLAPSYDHASSMGRNEVDETRIRRLNTKDKGDTVERYVERAMSAFYPGLKPQKPLSTLDAYREAAKLMPNAAIYWLDRLRQTTIQQYGEIFDKIPEPLISEAARRFALKMLEINRNRLIGN